MKIFKKLILLGIMIALLLTGVSALITDSAKFNFDLETNHDGPQNSYIYLERINTGESATAYFNHSSNSNNYELFNSNIKNVSIDMVIIDDFLNAAMFRHDITYQQYFALQDEVVIHYNSTNSVNNCTFIGLYFEPNFIEVDGNIWDNWTYIDGNLDLNINFTSGIIRIYTIQDGFIWSTQSRDAIVKTTAIGISWIIFLLGFMAYRRKNGNDNGSRLRRK